MGQGAGAQRAPPAAIGTGGRSAGLPRLLGQASLAATLVTAIVGSGIYASPQRVAQHQSSLVVVLVLWAAVGLLSLVGALLWAEMGSRLPVSGGNYVVLREAWGPRVAFFFGWQKMLLVAPSNRAALAIVSADYLAAVAPLDERGRLAAALGALFLVGAVNTVGLRWANRWHTAAAAAKILGLVGLGVLGAFLVAPAGQVWTGSPPAGSPGPVGGLALSVLLIFSAYEGWDRVANFAEEVRHPRRDLPRAMALGMGVIGGLYLLLNLGYHRVLGFDGVRASPSVLSEVADRTLGGSGAALVALLVLVSVLGSMSVSTLAHSRLLLAMARDGALFRTFERVHPSLRTPVLCIWLHLALAAAMLLMRRSFTELVVSAVFVNLVFYILRAHGLTTLRRLGIGGDDVYRAPFYPWLPAVFLTLLYGLFVTRLVFDWERAGVDLAVMAGVGLLTLLWFRLRREPPG